MVGKSSTRTAQNVSGNLNFHISLDSISRGKYVAIESINPFASLNIISLEWQLQP